MSFSYRSYSLWAAIACASAPGLAAQMQVQPRYELNAAYHTNRDLFPDDESASAGYTGLAEARIGIATPRSSTTIRPQVSYTTYPDGDNNDLGVLLDFATTFRSLRSQFTMNGGFDRRDTYSSELARSEFNPLNPDAPTTPETGRISFEGHRTLVTAAPQFVYQLTQRWNLGVEGLYQTSEYGGDGGASPLVSYDYYLVRPSVGRVLSPRSSVSFGVLASRQEARDGSVTTDAKGVSLVFDQRWSSSFTGKLELTAEREEIENAAALIPNERVNGIGGTYSTNWKGQISDLQLSVGRTFTPSGSGGKYVADQLQVQFNRKLSERITWGSSARLIRYSALASNTEFGDYDYVDVVSGLDWKLSRTWYVRGGGQYVRQKFVLVGGTAQNFVAYLSFGYQALERPQN